MAYEFIKNLASSIAPALVGLGTSLIINNQNVKKAQGEANIQRELSGNALQIALANERASLALANQGGGGKTTEETKSNLPLYIGLGIGGVVLLGVVIFAVTRK
jgi:hypothetical protein